MFRREIKSGLLIGAIAIKKFRQRIIFNELKKQFSRNFDRARNDDLDKYIIDEWRENVKLIEKDLLKNLRFDFLRHSVITKTMFVGNKPWTSKELKYIENNLSAKDMADLAAEDYIGKPIIINWKYLTSSNTIHHLYHLVRFINRTQCDLNKINTIIEWCGGYGNFAKIFWRFRKANCTYVIIDLPVFSCLQWIYLGSIFGKEKIHFIGSPIGEIIDGKINILPLSFLEKFKLNCDLFISTWAISESSIFAQDYVVNQGWFNSPHLLLAYQNNSEKFPTAGRIENLTDKKNIFIEDISFLPGNKYIFR